MVTEERGALPPSEGCEQRYRELFEHSSDAIFLMDVTPEGRFRFGEINPADEKLIGYRNAEVAGKFIEEVSVSEQLNSLITANFQRCIETGHAINFDETLDFSSGPRHLNTTLIPLRDKEGRVYRIAGIVRDISEQKQKAEHFALLNFALNRVQQAAVLIDEQGRFRYVNDESCRILGYAKEELLRLGVADIDPEWPQECWPERWEHLKTTGSRIFESRHKTREGRTFPVEISASHFEFEGRGYILALSQDITERKHAAERLKMLDQALNRIREPAYIINRDNMQFLYVNDEACRALGYSRDELQGLTVYDIDPDYTLEKAADVRRQAETLGMVTMERRHRAKDGRIFPVEINTSIFEYEGKKVSIALSRDITERKRAEEELQKLNASLEQRIREALARNREKDHLLIQQSRLAAMGEMVHNIAHHWRQPLNAVALLMANIQDSYHYGELTQEQLDDMVAKGEQIIKSMSATIDDFRDFFRPDEKKRTFPIARCLRKVNDILGASLGSLDIDLINHVEEEIVVYGFESEFSQVLINLINNAKEAIIAYRGKGGRIEVSASLEDQAIVVKVADDGGGIPEAILPKIFDPYFTTRDKGSGIGLYMNRMIIENKMGGEILARNTANGAEFIIRLPASAATE